MWGTVTWKAQEEVVWACGTVQAERRDERELVGYAGKEDVFIYYI